MNEIDGKYDVVRQLGVGAMGCVYEARHRVTSRLVAVKVVLDDVRLEPAAIARFKREARAVASIESEHITQVLDGGIDGATNAPYLVMELLSGEDLVALVKRIGPLRPDLALRIIAQLLAGLARAHAAGVVHRDIKPANIFMARKESGEITVKLCDFGIAKVKTDPFAAGNDHALTQSSTLLGSPAYMSPEQAKGDKDLDARADIWSAGVVLYQLLSGKAPHYEIETLGLLLLAICSEPTPPIRGRAPWVPSTVAAIVGRALAPSIDARFQSATAMGDAIAALLPEGARIEPSMLTAMADEERANVASMAPAVDAFAETTSAPLAATPREAVARTRARTWIAGGIALTAIAGAGMAARALRTVDDATPMRAEADAQAAAGAIAGDEAPADAGVRVAAAEDAGTTTTAIASDAGVSTRSATRGPSKPSAVHAIAKDDAGAKPEPAPSASASAPIFREFH